MMKPKLINSYNSSSAISRARCVQAVIIDSGFIKKIVNIVYDWGKAFLDLRALVRFWFFSLRGCRHFLSIFPITVLNTATHIPKSLD
jgi:hypothetical protein